MVAWLAPQCVFVFVAFLPSLRLCLTPHAFADSGFQQQHFNRADTDSRPPPILISWTWILSDPLPDPSWFILCTLKPSSCIYVCITFKFTFVSNVNIPAFPTMDFEGVYCFCTYCAPNSLGELIRLMFLKQVCPKDSPINTQEASWTW